MTAEQLAVAFHEIYERLAPQFGYETRTETRRFDPTTPNGQLMIAVCGEIQARAALAPDADLADAIFAAIKHGDEQHQKWLYDKLHEFFAARRSHG